MTFKTHDDLVLWDISPEVSSDTAVFPDDCAYEKKQVCDTRKGDHLTLSNIHTTLHIGAHADAPLHYHAKGVAIDERDPKLYIGPCQVIRVSLPKGERILKKHLGQIDITASRVLFRTDSFLDPKNWNSDFNSLSVELIEALGARGVKLIGIDTPSVDPETSKALEAHQAIFRADLAILEGLVLKDVPDGNYFLSALPLKLTDADAGPVRAVLLRSTALVRAGLCEGDFKKRFEGDVWP